MIKEYSKHLDFYQLYAQSSYSQLIPESSWGDKEQARRFLEKYWLPEQEYQTKWKPIQKQIFVKRGVFPEVRFSTEFELTAFRGGCLFLEEDFNQLQSAIKEIGKEKEFIIIQNSQEFKDGEPMFKMKFPIDITWHEMISGNYISAVLFEMMFNEYFVFSESRKWCKYAASDYKLPLDIIGFQSDYSSIFRNNFSQSKEESEEIKEWLLSSYRNIL